MAEKKNNQDIVALLVSKHGLEQGLAEALLQEFFAGIEEALDREKQVKIKGFGAFKLISVESRESVDVNTGERIQIKGHTKVSFAPDASLRDMINKPFSHFETVVLNDGTVFEEESIPEPPPIPDIPEEKQQAEKPEQKKSGKGTYLAVALLLALVLFGGGLFYYKSQAPAEKPGASTREIPETPPGANAIPAPADTVSVKDTIAARSLPEESDKDVAVKPVKSAAPPAPASVNPDSTNYRITGTKTIHTLLEGETLVRLARKYYGTKDMWPYILMHNRRKIKNPDMVPTGTILDIPELEKK